MCRAVVPLLAAVVLSVVAQDVFHLDHGVSFLGEEAEQAAAPKSYSQRESKVFLRNASNAAAAKLMPSAVQIKKAGKRPPRTALRSRSTTMHPGMLKAAAKEMAALSKEPTFSTNLVDHFVKPHRKKKGVKRT